MDIFYFTEKAFRPASLENISMNHMETSIWFDKKEKELRNSLSLSSSDSTKTSSVPLPNPRIRKFTLKCTKTGNALINLSTVEGVITIRTLWKEEAWGEYCSMRSDQYIEDFYRIGSFSLDFWNEEVNSFSYKKLNDDEKKEIIKLYFMDYFLD
jgi:hypothetical protein